MYVILDKNTEELFIFKDMADIVRKLGLSRSKVVRWLTSGEYTPENYEILKPIYIQAKSGRGVYNKGNCKSILHKNRADIKITGKGCDSE